MADEPRGDDVDTAQYAAMMISDLTHRVFGSEQELTAREERDLQDLSYWAWKLYDDMGNSLGGDLLASGGVIEASPLTKKSTWSQNVDFKITAHGNGQPPPNTDGHSFALVVVALTLTQLANREWCEFCSLLKRGGVLHLSSGQVAINPTPKPTKVDKLKVWAKDEHPEFQIDCQADFAIFADYIQDKGKDEMAGTFRRYAKWKPRKRN